MPNIPDELKSKLKTKQLIHKVKRVRITEILVDQSMLNPFYDICKVRVVTTREELPDGSLKHECHYEECSTNPNVEPWSAISEEKFNKFATHEALTEHN